MRAVPGYSLPGEGSSVVISAVTVVAPAGVVVARHPSRLDQGICFADAGKDFGAFVSAMKGDIRGGKALPEHFMWA